MVNEAEKGEIQSGAPRVRTYERDVVEFLKKEEGTAAKFALAEQFRRIAMVGTPTPDASVVASGERRMAGEVRVQSSPSRPFTKGGVPEVRQLADEGEGVVSAEIKTPLRPSSSLGTPPLRIRAGGEQAVPIPSPHMENLRRNARSLVLWSVLFLVLAGVVGIGYWYFINLPPREMASVSVDGQKIILADTEKTIDTAHLARETFLSQFARERAATLALSAFVRVVPTKMQNAAGEGVAQALTTEEFLLLLEARADGELTRALAPSFALGLRGLPQNRAFLVFKTPYYRTALAGMLRWEETLLRDLGSLFGTPAANAAAPASASALAGRATGFLDRTLKNRDVRALLGEDGKPLLLWGFADNRTIIITNDEDTFQKVTERLVATK